MELVNQTPVPVNLTVAELEEGEPRIGLVTAKLTCRFDARGVVEIDAQDPLPLLAADEPTELGLMPRDDLPRRDPAFEVIVLGAARSPVGKPVKERLVTLTVGSETRQLLAIGDRTWRSRKEISPPLPFERMPLGFDRAFGGTCEVLLDEGAPVDVTHPMNRYGRGFDPERQASSLGRLLKCPSGFPRWERSRSLPNLENPAERITRWEDEPRPWAWSAVPMDTGLHLLRSMRVPASGAPLPKPGRELQGAFAGEPLTDGLFHRAHPDWVIAVPAREAIVTMDGLLPEGPASFRLPALSVIADFCVGGAVGSIPLVPQVLLLLTEQRRFTLLYRAAFTVPGPSEAERSLRIRLEEGWNRPMGGISR